MPTFVSQDYKNNLLFSFSFCVSTATVVLDANGTGIPGLYLTEESIFVPYGP